MPSPRSLFAAIVAATAALTGAARAEEVVQFPIDGVMNGRSVTTLTSGALAPWMTNGIDGATAGFMTAAASQFLGNPATLKMLPDDGRFPADARHPEIVLHFSNDAPADSPQTHLFRSGATSDVTLSVPPAVYSKVFVFFTAENRGEYLTVRMTYSDGFSDGVNELVPGHQNTVHADDPMFFALASDLANCDAKNEIFQTGSNNVHGMELRPSVGRTLTSLTLHNTGGVVFWGATGTIGGSDAADGGADVDGGGADLTAGDDAPLDSADAPEPSDAGADTVAVGGAGGPEASADGAAGAAGDTAGDAGADAVSSSGCSCRTTGEGHDGEWLFVMLALVVTARRSRARR
jgi:MYXO-CTERM domain-containing protein